MVDRESMTTSGRRDVTATSGGNCNCSSKSNKNSQSLAWRSRVCDETGRHWCDCNGRVVPAGTKRTNRSDRVAMVTSTARWVAGSFQNLCKWWRMTESTESCRQVYRLCWSATARALRTWREVAGFPQRQQAGSMLATPHRRRFVADGAVSVVAWRAKQSSASLQLCMSCCQERSWCMRSDHCSHFPWTCSVRKCSSCSTTSMSWMYWFTRLRVDRGERGGSVVTVGWKGAALSDLQQKEWLCSHIVAGQFSAWVIVWQLLEALWRKRGKGHRSKATSRRWWWQNGGITRSL